MKIHSTASAAWISGSCHFRCKDTTFPSTFIPKTEFSNLFVQKTPFQLGDRKAQWGSLLSLLYLGRCWVLQPETAEQGGGISVSLNSMESGHGKQAVPSALQQCLLQAGSPLEDGAHNMGSAQQSESPGCSPWAHDSLISHICGTSPSPKKGWGFTTDVSQSQWELPPEMKPFHLLPAGPDTNEHFSFSGGLVSWKPGRSFWRQEAVQGKRTNVESWCGVRLRWKHCMWAGEIGDSWSISKEEHRSEKVRLKRQISLNALDAWFL